jgi:hypothetical protein
MIMAYSILLVFEKPDLSKLENAKQWDYFATKVANIPKQNTEIQKLGENVLLLSLQKNLTGISYVAQSIGNLSYKYIILSEDVEWHVVSKEV